MGLASGEDWTMRSSGESGAVKLRVAARTVRKRARRAEAPVFAGCCGGLCSAALCVCSSVWVGILVDPLIDFLDLLGLSQLRSTMILFE